MSFVMWYNCVRLACMLHNVLSFKLFGLLLTVRRKKSHASGCRSSLKTFVPKIFIERLKNNIFFCFHSFTETKRFASGLFCSAVVGYSEYSVCQFFL